MKVCSVIHSAFWALCIGVHSVFFSLQSAAADSEAKNTELNRGVEELNKLLKKAVESMRILSTIANITAFHVCSMVFKRYVYTKLYFVNR